MVAGETSEESAAEKSTLLLNHPNPPDSQIAITLLLQRYIAAKIIIPMKDRRNQWFSLFFKSFYIIGISNFKSLTLRPGLHEHLNRNAFL